MPPLAKFPVGKEPPDIYLPTKFREKNIYCYDTNLFHNKANMKST